MFGPKKQMFGLIPGGPDFVPAAAGTETAGALTRFGRRVYLRIVVSAFAVFLFNAILRRFFSGGGIGAYVALAFEAVAFIGVLLALASYGALVRTRRILRTNPWVEWHANVGDLKVRGRSVGRVIVLVHPEWAESEVRTLHPFRLAKDFPLREPVTVWAAGNPSRSLVISLTGGGSPVRGVKWRPAAISTALQKRAMNVNKD